MGKMFKGYEEGFVPFGPAAGAINGLNLEEIEAKIMDVAASPAAFDKWGSTTYNGGPGNSGLTYYHNERTGMTSNSMGLPNIGHQAAVKLQQRLQPIVESYGKPLIPSFSPGQGEDPLKVLPVMAYGFAKAGAQIIEVNYSCPNKFVEGGMAVEPTLGYDLDSMFEIDEAIIGEVGTDITIIRKLPPPVGLKQVILPGTVEYFNEARGKVALGNFNTIGGQSVLNEFGDPALRVGEKEANIGGLSGWAFGPMSIRGLRSVKQIASKSIGIFSSVGVDSGREIYRRVDEEGADLTEGVTVLWENEKRGKKFGQTITQMAKQYGELREAA